MNPWQAPRRRLNGYELLAVRFAAQGMTNEAIGRELHISGPGAASLLSRASYALRAVNRASLIDRAWRAGELTHGGDN